MLLFELFEKSSALKFTKNTDAHLEAKAVINDRELVFHADLKDGAWDVVFFEPASKMPTGSGNRGNAPEVMSCAVKFVRQLIKLKSPEKITFTAGHVYVPRGDEWIKSTARADLYNRMLSRFKSEFDYDVESIEDPHPHRSQRHFVLTKQ